MTSHDSVLLAARAVTGAAFLIIGLRNIGGRQGVAGFIRANGLPAPVFLATLALRCRPASAR